MGPKSSSDGGDGRRRSEYLLYTAICMVGLPVEVQVKDGSLYSGILHTASFDDSHGIVLKKARKIGKGENEKNFATGSVVDTLVVFSADFVQVVVKDFRLPVKGMVGDVDGSVEFEANNFDSEVEPRALIANSGILDHNSISDAKVVMGTNVQKMLPNGDCEKKVETKRLDVKKAVELPRMPTVSVHQSQVGEDMPKGEAPSQCLVDGTSEAKKMAHEDRARPDTSSKDLNDSRIGSPANSVGPEDQTERIATNSTDHPSLDAEKTTSSHPRSCLYGSAPSIPSPSTSPNISFCNNNSYCNTITKEFKLNPEAKVFFPMSANSRSSPAAAPTIASAAYIPHIHPKTPIATPLAGTEVNSFANLSAPAKLVQYDGLVTGYTGVPAQYSRPIIGNASGWQQPVRFHGPYQTVQAGTAYVHPPSQTVMVGRTGQLVYVHPLAQNAIQATSVLSQGSPYPLLNPSQPNIPKFQAPPPLQLCVSPPLVSGATQPFIVPSQVPLHRPFPVVRPVLVPGGNGFFGSKLQ